MSLVCLGVTSNPRTFLQPSVGNCTNFFYRSFVSGSDRCVDRKLRLIEKTIQLGAGQTVNFANSTLGATFFLPIVCVRFNEIPICYFQCGDSRNIRDGKFSCDYPEKKSCTSIITIRLPTACHPRRRASASIVRKGRVTVCRFTSQ